MNHIKRYQYSSALRNICAGVLLILLQTLAQALPVGFKDSWMTMGELGKDYSEVNLIYTFTPHTSVGVGGVGLKYEDKATMQKRRVEMVDTHISHRIGRWNFPEAQANIYLQMGIGQAKGNFFNNSQTVLQPGLQLDYETRRIYTALKWHGSYAKAFDYTRYSLAGGFSFYATEYDEWQPWVVLEASRKGGDLKDATEITPYFRLIHKTLFIEAGAPYQKGKSQGLKVNFRYTF
ncbi:hypothetical protein [Variovorax sp. PCZ-1]|uniref:hypothetical protein n=1 Tax=Variovorax sp. PCZ-1 TaxID=2835533 RepID=UPI001BCD53A1|nr:hypothetical protein [Variovorax sp. PCZ-1]MBS7806366.1 hypothetical protein [Variovorax sp. PCZ-1]